MEVDTGKKVGVTSDAAAKIKELERENKELKQANEILKKAAAFCSSGLDRNLRSSQFIDLSLVVWCRAYLPCCANCAINVLPL